MRFRLADFSQASNQSVPFSPLSRLARKIREFLIEGASCATCGTKIKPCSFKTSLLLSREQCYVECQGCESKFHFLCYMEAAGARKLDGAVYGWNQVSRNRHEIASCPKCKKQGSCLLVIDGEKKPFVADEIVWTGVKDELK